VLTTRPDELVAAVWRFAHDPEEAHRVGAAARQSALARYGLGRFLADWDARIDAWAAGGAPARPADVRS
jgi:hypothetical protein